MYRAVVFLRKKLEKTTIRHRLVPIALVTVNGLSGQLEPEKQTDAGLLPWRMHRVK